MKIAIIGAGAMGCIYGGKLAKHNEVYLVHRRQEAVDKMNDRGILLEEEGLINTYPVKAVAHTENIGVMDLVILFVKAPEAKEALESYQNIIGKDTYLMALQNGSGHEALLMEFVDEGHIIIGTTEDGGTLLEDGHVRRVGTGKTNIGMIAEQDKDFLQGVKQTFDACGFQVRVYDNVQQLIWDKLVINASLSALTAVLQVKSGYIAENTYAWELAQKLVRETIEVGTAMGLTFDEAKTLERVRQVSVSSREGVTSICKDISMGRQTEVDRISGSVATAGKQYGIPTPTHDLVISLVHALEQRGTYQIEK